VGAARPELQGAALRFDFPVGRKRRLAGLEAEAAEHDKPERCRGFFYLVEFQGVLSLHSQNIKMLPLQSD